MKKYLLTWLCIFGPVLALSGCGGASGATAFPTATTIPTFSYVIPTEAPAVATVAAATSVAQAGSGLDPQAVERGRGRYEALECATCHGENGEGTEDGSSLITSTQSEEDFISFMRSGGDMGPDHQFSTNRLSESGGRNLYQYLLSIRQAG